MKLVSSNDPDRTKATIERAIAAYKDVADVPKCLAILTELKGVGPATASLLLAVHDPQNIPFFADEAFYYLCGSGREVHLGYTTKEYLALLERALWMVRRLGVRAADVEKAAFVLMHEMNTGEPRVQAKRPKLPKVVVPQPAGSKRKAASPGGSGGRGRSPSKRIKTA